MNLHSYLITSIPTIPLNFWEFSLESVFVLSSSYGKNFIMEQGEAEMDIMVAWI